MTNDVCIERVTSSKVDVDSPKDILRLEVTAGDSRASESQEAFEKLKKHAIRGNPVARDAVCRLVIDHDHDGARRVALAQDFTPRNPLHRALFFFLTGQWKKYECLDFDRSMLRSIFGDADDSLRCRITDIAREHDREEWVDLVISERRVHFPLQTTGNDWSAIVRTLRNGERRRKMWRYVEIAPAYWAARMLRCLSDSGWKPESLMEEKEFGRLLELSTSCMAGNIGFGAVDGQYRRLCGHSGNVGSLAMTPDGQFMISGSLDGTIGLWSLPDARLRKTLSGHKGPVECLAVSEDGRLLASGSGFEDNTIRLWNLPDGMFLKTLEGHSGWIKYLSISSDGTTLISAGCDDSIRIWSLPDGKKRAVLKGLIRNDEIPTVSRDGSLLASGSSQWDGTIRIRSLPDGRLVNELKGHRTKIKCVAFSPCGRMLASGGLDNRIFIWRIRDGKKLKTLDGHEGWIRSLVFNSDGSLLASAGEDFVVKLWSIPDGDLLKSLHGYTSSIWTLAFTPDSSMLACGGNWENTISLWGSELFQLAQLPIEHATLDDLDRIKRELGKTGLREPERNWLEFIKALICWRFRSSVTIEPVDRIRPGETDVIIE